MFPVPPGLVPSLLAKVPPAPPPEPPGPPILVGTSGATPPPLPPAVEVIVEKTEGFPGLPSSSYLLLQLHQHQL